MIESRNSERPSKKKSNLRMARQPKALKSSSSRPVYSFRIIPAIDASTLDRVTKKWTMVLR